MLQITVITDGYERLMEPIRYQKVSFYSLRLKDTAALLRHPPSLVEWLLRPEN